MAEILIVENESIIAMHLKELIENMGHHVIGIASRGEDAMVMAERKKPEIALVDISLKGEMNGVEVAESIRWRFGSSIIYITGSPNSKLYKKARESVHAGILDKPFRTEELVECIKKALSAEKQA